MVLNLFAGLKSLLKRRDVCIDNAVFRIHWFVTSMILVISSIIVSARQYFGNPIECIHTDKIPPNIINTYCWIHSTFTLPDALAKKIGSEVPFPGIDNSGQSNGERSYHSYYQWVCFVLFIQAIFFYTPHYLWKVWEGGLMKTVVMGLKIAILTEEERGKKKQILLDYLVRHMRTHRMYVFRYFFCEFLCLVNVVGQLYFMNHFVNGEFMDLGVRVLNQSISDQEQRQDPLVFVFPRMTKCTFRRFGVSGDVQSYDALCILPQNIINEKIYIILWFWFMFLAVMCGLVVIYRMFIAIFPVFRPFFLHARCRIASRHEINIVLRKTNIGDWFLLYMLGKNVDPVMFKEIVSEMAKKVEPPVSDMNNKTTAA